jgi:hypothetical protein
VDSRHLWSNSHTQEISLLTLLIWQVKKSLQTPSFGRKLTKHGSYGWGHKKALLKHCPRKSKTIGVLYSLGFSMVRGTARGKKKVREADQTSASKRKNTGKLVFRPLLLDDDGEGGTFPFCQLDQLTNERVPCTRCLFASARGTGQARSQIEHTFQQRGANE